MCGICGEVDFAGVERRAVEVMAGALAHRGPDGSGFHVSDVAALGHRRLSIIDLQTGGQPLANEDNTVWLTFNGEIYNYRALRDDLLARGHRFRTQSDSEVIVHLYEQYGTECVTRLQGMFAFAIWDSRQQRLFAARDRLGQKPFYYVHQQGALAFASEIKALLAYDPSLATLNLAALDQYLSLRLIAPPHSMFEKIKKLPPAHTLVFDARSGLRIQCYWRLSYEPKLSGSADDLTDELQARLIQCLKAHTVSDVPVGAFLSGGLDSSLVVALLQQHISHAPLQTFSVGLPYKDYDETPFARLVAERYGTRHHERTLPSSLLDSLPQLVWQLDEPSDPLSLCYSFIAKMAHEHVKVVLGGDGGDELFGGYDRYYGQRYAGYYALLPPALRKSVIGPLLHSLPDGHWYKSRRHRLKWLHAMSFHEAGARYAHSLGYFYFAPSMRERLYGSELLDAAVGFDAGEPIRTAFETAQATDALDRMLSADSQIRLPDHSVMILDRMTMAHGLEARSPLMDHELAEFAARLPQHLKVRGRSLRYIQMRLARRYLPEPLLHRAKQGFSSALPYMLKNEYHDLFQRLLGSTHLARDGFFRQPTINALLAEHQAHKADHGNRLWLLLNSELWYRLFIERETVADLTEQIRQPAKSFASVVGVSVTVDKPESRNGRHVREQVQEVDSGAEKLVRRN